MKILALSALLLTVPAAADTPGPSFADAIGICRAGLIEKLQGGDGSKEGAAIKALPPQSQDGVRVVCFSYHQGIADYQVILQGNPALQVSI